jgi:hypothetical protein
MSRKGVAVLVRIELHEDANLPQVVQAGDAIGFAFGSAQSRQQHRRQDGNDGNDDEQLDQGEGRGTAGVKKTTVWRGAFHGSGEKLRPLSGRVQFESGLQASQQVQSRVKLRLSDQAETPLSGEGMLCIIDQHAGEGPCGVVNDEGILLFDRRTCLRTSDAEPASANDKLS